jgi:gluconolactonase
MMNTNGLDTRDMAVWQRMPDEFRRPIVTPWAVAQAQGRAVDCFIEGPCFDVHGNLYVVDIPHGRIFRVTPPGQWSVIAQYDGEPNGLALHPDGRHLYIADYRNGIMRVDIGTGAVEPVLGRRNGERFKGPNDLVFARNGDLYFTDQGQTGLHDPTGRVYRLSASGHLDMLIGNGPSPNGLVLSPDESVLFVAMTRDNAVWRIPLFTDGGTGKVGRFCAFFGVGGPDGLGMDTSGNLFVAHVSLGAIFVVTPDGETVRRYRSPVGKATTNIAFGGPQGRQAFVTESASGTILTFDWDAGGATNAALPD